MKRKFLSLFSLFIILSTAMASAYAELTVERSSLIYSENDGAQWVNVVGIINNGNLYPAEEVLVEVSFFDEQGNLIDAVAENLYPLVVPEGEKGTFKVYTLATMPSSSYASHTVRILNSYDIIPSGECSNSTASSDDERSPLAAFLVGWGPMIIVVIIWLVVARIYNGKNSPQQKMVDLMELQVKSTEQNNREAKRLADAVEKVVNKDSDSVDGKDE
ncbi:hypothetical protein EZV61_06975 [Corallincola luteus]|uniref:Uncharacterized protein n=1 Tax=Corallincola luteus TaxID=1775177 RepID=A0ABY2ALU9_9GAMM|nr:hypothetical protein [Corallincola luteus]TCI03931.1 hypothetical protein EZV61_06975 [Corallincola luteus]